MFPHQGRFQLEIQLEFFAKVFFSFQRFDKYGKQIMCLLVIPSKHIHFRLWQPTSFSSQNTVCFYVLLCVSIAQFLHVFYVCIRMRVQSTVEFQVNPRVNLRKAIAKPNSFSFIIWVAAAVAADIMSFKLQYLMCHSMHLSRLLATNYFVTKCARNARAKSSLDSIQPSFTIWNRSQTCWKHLRCWWCVDMSYMHACVLKFVKKLYQARKFTLMAKTMHAITQRWSYLSHVADILVNECCSLEIKAKYKRNKHLIGL